MSEVCPLDITKSFKSNVIKLIEYLIETLDADTDLIAQAKVSRRKGS